MRTDTIDLEIFETRVRVICEDQRGMKLLRAALAEYMVEEPAPLGFALRAPKDRERLHVLLDRSGLVLGRSRNADECLAVLASHLAAFVPAPSGTTRLRVRALLGDNSKAVLAPFPVLASPPMVERRLHRAQHQMIDRLAIDVTSDGCLEMSPTPWPTLSSLDSPLGHLAASSNPSVISGVLVPSTPQYPHTRAGLVWMFATATIPASGRDTVMALADRLASLTAMPVNLAKPSSAYEALMAVS